MANGDPPAENCPHTQNDHPIKQRSGGCSTTTEERESAGVDNFPTELVQADGEAVITALKRVCNKIWLTGE